MTMTPNDMLLTMAWVFPLVVGLAQMVRRHKMIRFAPLGALPALLAALFIPVDKTLELPALLLGSHFMLDVTGKTFLFFTSVLWLVAGLFAVEYLKKDERRPTFFMYFLLAMTGNIGLIIAGDMLSYYLWFALMSFASYGLVIHTRTDFARRASNVYIALVVIGEVMLFAALVLIASETGTTRLSDIAASGGISTLPNVLVFISFGIKAGVAMLHVWLPLAHPAAPVPASAVLSGTMIKAGLLGWIRFLNPGDLSPEWGEAIIVIGLITAFYGALIGVWQDDPKAVLAYSSISQMGLITVGVGMLLVLPDQFETLALTAVALYALHHALAKGALFLGVGLVGSTKRVVYALLIPALALAGLPLLSGSTAKAALKMVVDELPRNWYYTLNTLLPLAAVGTTLLMARFLQLMWVKATGEKKPAGELWIIWLVGIAGVVLIIPAWPDASAALTESLKADKVWVSTWPVLLGAFIAVVFGFAARYVPALANFRVRAGDVLYFMEIAAGVVITLAVAIQGGVTALTWAIMKGTERALTPGERQDSTLGAYEGRLSEWIVAGSWLLAFSLGFLILIWLST